MFFKVISHIADLQLEVYGTSLADLFANAVVAMFQSIGPEACNCTRNTDGLLMCENLPEKQDVVVHAQTKEELLVNFLSQALYLSDVYNQAYLAVIIHKISETEAHATLSGIHIENFEKEIKAVTYHNLTITEKNNRWYATIVFDI